MTEDSGPACMHKLVVRMRIEEQKDDDCHCCVVVFVRDLDFLAILVSHIEVLLDLRAVVGRAACNLRLGSVHATSAAR